ncbi:hypothetical protein RchiOBHm_Chr6g0288951 [Rosa chinensis]|uniref:Uncharacterized protein n=1 Tax=Rosa chinensis TaxID=74649 RepID=A0A2P6PVG1_ROSCH|nr:hypothetical protein RchiOBHm_Chr6g0288951 [Rosa chinensis]
MTQLISDLFVMLFVDNYMDMVLLYFLCCSIALELKQATDLLLFSFFF